MKKFFIFSVLILFVVACSSGGEDAKKKKPKEKNFEDEIVGHWKRIDETDGCDPLLENGFRFNDDDSVEGIEGFKTYEIKKDNNEHKIILSGGYEDTRRYEVSISEGVLNILEYDTRKKINEGLACDMKKVD